MEKLTYDVLLRDEKNSNNKGFEMTIENCKMWIDLSKESEDSYFQDDKGGIVQVVCNETGEVVYE